MNSNIELGICIRYGEIALKGKNRGKFLNKLIKNIKSFLDETKLEYETIKTISRRIIIHISNIDLDNKKELELFFNFTDKFKDLKNIFGITSFSPCLITDADFEKIKQTSIILFDNLFEENKTFCIDSKRLDKKFKFTSMELNEKLGEEIINKFNAKVKLKTPDIKIGIELLQEKALIHINKIKCYGGLPVGTEGKLISLISPGIDSSVASWMMMKRGCSIVFVTFYSNKQQLKTVETLIEKLKKYSYGVEIKLLAFEHKKEIEKYLACLKQRKLESYICLFCKKMMLEKAVETANNESAWGIITGDSIGQVASQTVENIFFVRKGIDLPIFSPVIGMNKTEIITISREIGTFEIFNENNSKIGKCPFLPKNPATKVTKQKINKLMKLCDN